MTHLSISDSDASVNLEREMGALSAALTRMPGPGCDEVRATVVEGLASDLDLAKIRAHLLGTWVGVSMVAYGYERGSDDSGGDDDNNSSNSNTNANANANTNGSGSGSGSSANGTAEVDDGTCGSSRGLGWMRIEPGDWSYAVQSFLLDNEICRAGEVAMLPLEHALQSLYLSRGGRGGGGGGGGAAERLSVLATAATPKKKG